MTHSIHQIGKDIIICSDEEIKELDWCLLDNNVGESSGFEIKQCLAADVVNGEYTFRESNEDFFTIGRCEKIISSNCGIGLPLTNSIENLNQLWEEFESERLALINSEIELPNHIPQDFNTEIWISGARIIGFKEGRKSKQGVYTLEDMYMLASKVVGDIAKNYSNADWNLFTTPKMIADEFISQLSIHEGKVSCEITNDSITVTKYL